METTKARREVPPPEEKRETPPLCREEEWKDVVVDEMVDAREEREEDISNVMTINVTRVLWIKKKKKKKKKRAEGTLSI